MTSVRAHRPSGPKARTALIVVQPTPFCNINCTYCYLPERARREQLPLSSVGPIFERLLAFPTVTGTVTIVWHAGEPMVLPPEYYAAAFEAIQSVTPVGVKVSHAFQTNGTLLNEDWCELAKAWDVRIGVSLDGPRHLHDIHRVDRAGRGTFDRTMRGISLLTSAGINFHVITVLTSQSLDAPDELYAFYRNHGITQIAFNVEEREGVHASSSLESEDVITKYRTFLARFWSLAQADAGKIYLRELEQALRAIRENSPNAERINTQATPFAILNVDVAGRLSTFSPELLGMRHDDYGDFVIGNVLRDRYEVIENSPKLRRLALDIEKGVDRCKRECAYFRVCGGGAPSNKLYENGSFTSTVTTYCRLTRMVPTDIALNMIDVMPPTDGSRIDPEFLQS